MKKTYIFLLVFFAIIHISYAQKKTYQYIAIIDDVAHNATLTIENSTTCKLAWTLLSDLGSSNMSNITSNTYKDGFIYKKEKGDSFIFHISEKMSDNAVLLRSLVLRDVSQSLGKKPMSHLLGSIGFANSKEDRTQIVLIEKTK